MTTQFRFFLKMLSTPTSGPFGKKDTPVIPGLKRECPVKVDADVENFNSYAYGALSYFCNLSGQPWEMIAYGERFSDNKKCIELEFQITHPVSGKEPLKGSMFFDITACENPSDDSLWGDEPWLGNGPTTLNSLNAKTFLSQEKERPNREDNGFGFKAYKG